MVFPGTTPVEAVAGASEDGTAWLSSKNGAFRRMVSRLAVVAPSETTVLIRGETGTGKEILARELHRRNPRRRKGPFFSVNCGALHESLLASELFGHERGAFSGAVKKKRGLVEMAAGGTLFLDEIGELSLAMQVKILRLLQEHEFMRLGGEQVLKSDARIVAATHRDLEKMVREGAFRADLYYRIQVVPLVVPSLRSRTEDLIDLAGFIVRRLAGQHKRRVPALSLEVQHKLLHHAWPGNVRELENVLERALLLCAGDEIDEVEIDSSGSAVEETDDGLLASRRSLERDYIVNLLARHQGNVKQAAAAARVNRRTLHRRINALKLEPDEFRRMA
jgi:two-component system response regulator HydG